MSPTKQLFLWPLAITAIVTLTNALHLDGTPAGIANFLIEIPLSYIAWLGILWFFRGLWLLGVWIRGRVKGTP